MQRYLDMPQSYTPDAELLARPAASFTFSSYDRLKPCVHAAVAHKTGEAYEKWLSGYQAMATVNTFASREEMERDDRRAYSGEDALFKLRVMLEKGKDVYKLRLPESSLHARRMARREEESRAVEALLKLSDDCCGASAERIVGIVEPTVSATASVDEEKSERRKERLTRSERAVQDLYANWPHQAQPTWKDLELLECIPDSPDSVAVPPTQTFQPTVEESEAMDRRLDELLNEVDLDELLRCDERLETSADLFGEEATTIGETAEKEKEKESSAVEVFEISSDEEDEREAEDDCVTVQLKEEWDRQKRLKRGAHVTVYQARKRLEKAEKRLAEVEVAWTNAKLACIRHEVRVDARRLERSKAKLRSSVRANRL